MAHIYKEKKGKYKSKVWSGKHECILQYPMTVFGKRDRGKLLEKMGLSTIFSCSKPLRSELEIASKHHPVKLVTVGLMRLLQQTRLCLFAMNRHDPSKLYVCSPNRHDPSKLHDCSPNRHDPPKHHDCTEQS